MSGQSGACARRQGAAPIGKIVGCLVCYGAALLLEDHVAQTRGTCDCKAAARKRATPMQGQQFIQPPAARSKKPGRIIARSLPQRRSSRLQGNRETRPVRKQRVRFDKRQAEVARERPVIIVFPGISAGQQRIFGAYPLPNRLRHGPEQRTGATPWAGRKARVAGTGVAPALPTRARPCLSDITSAEDRTTGGPPPDSDPNCP